MKSGLTVNELGQNVILRGKIVKLAWKRRSQPWFNVAEPGATVDQLASNKGFWIRQ